MLAMPAGMSDTTFDARGCLTDLGLAAVRGASPGGVSPKLAEHLAACRRCQYRLLSGGHNPPLARGKAKGARLGRRIIALAVAGVVLIAASLALLALLVR